MKTRTVESIYAIARRRTQESISRVAAKKKASDLQPKPEPQSVQAPKVDKYGLPLEIDGIDLTKLSPQMRYYYRHRHDPGFAEKHRACAAKSVKKIMKDPIKRKRRIASIKRSNDRRNKRCKEDPAAREARNEYMRDWRHKRKLKQLEELMAW